MTVNHLKSLASDRDIPDQLDEDDGDPKDRQGKGKQMIRFVKKGGRPSRSLEYNHLYSVDFNAAGDLALTFSADVVIIEGQNLEPLLDEIERHVKARVTERDELHAQVTKDPYLVTKITFSGKPEGQ